MNYMFKDYKLYWFDLDNILTTRNYDVDDLLREFDNIVLENEGVCHIPFKTKITTCLWRVHYYVRFDNVYYTGIQEVNIFGDDVLDDLISSIVDLQTKNMLVRQLTQKVYHE